MLDAIDLDACSSCTGQGRKQNAAQGVTEGCAVSTLERLYDELAVGTIGLRFNTFNSRFFDSDHLLPSLVS
jgi:hypothetical protein